MALTAFVLIALQEAKEFCNDQVNVSVRPPSPPLTYPGHIHLGGWAVAFR